MHYLHKNGSVFEEWCEVSQSKMCIILIGGKFLGTWVMSLYGHLGAQVFSLAMYFMNPLSHTFCLLQVPWFIFLTL